MKKHLVRNESELEKVLEGEINLLAFERHRRPREYPCIVMVAYAGAKFGEVDFVYRKDFGEEQEETLAELDARLKESFAMARKLTNLIGKVVD